MKQLLNSYADETPPPATGPSLEYTTALQAWVDEHMRTSGELWDAIALVLSAAIQLDLETPTWCRCRPGGDALNNAIDTVIEALPPRGMQAFDKKQGA